jgi:ethylbenzene dioxygenase ferredoxin component
MTEQSTRHFAVKTDELIPGEVRQIAIGALTLAVYNIDGTYYATDDTCTHAYASLSEGSVDGDVIECPLHQGCFHIPTGKAVSPPAVEDLRTYAVKVVGTDVFIELPED